MSCIQVACLLNKGEIQVVWASNAQVDDVHLCGNGIIEGIQKPGCERDLQAQAAKITCMLCIQAFAADAMHLHRCLLRERGTMWQETHLIIGENPEGIDVCFYGKARAGCVTARHNTSNKCAMAQSILQRRLMRPIGSLSAQD